MDFLFLKEKAQKVGWIDKEKWILEKLEDEDEQVNKIDYLKLLSNE